MKSLRNPIASHMSRHVMFRRDLNELKVSRKAERPHVRPRVGLSAFAYIYDYIYIYPNHFLRFSTSKIYGFPWISHLSIFSIPRRASAEFLASPQFQLTLTRRLGDPERCEPAPEGDGRAIGGYRGWPLLQQLGIG